MRSKPQQKTPRKNLRIFPKPNRPATLRRG